MKRQLSSQSSQASFVTADSKPENDECVEPIPSLLRAVSPPPIKPRTKPTTTTTRTTTTSTTLQQHKSTPTAAVEAGQVSVQDHISFFSSRLLATRRPSIPGQHPQHPQLPHTSWLALYQRNQHPHGHHFVVHQHDHPVAGTHYDLRLQCNATSSISFAIMYGLPGDPNSKRLNRNATETRVHNIWNHLIETASHETGTMLIWDTGEYEVLPYYPERRAGPGSDSEHDSDSDGSEEASNRSGTFASLSEPEKLAHSFARRKIRIRLHGTRLPPPYTIGIRLTLDNDRDAQPRAPGFKQRRKQVQQPPSRARQIRRSSSTSSPSSEESKASRDHTPHRLRPTVSSLQRIASPPRNSKQASHIVKKSIPDPARTDSDNPSPDEDVMANASEQEADAETIRLTNAYPGASNTIDSIHQRKWYLSLDRRLSGFHPIRKPDHINHHTKTYWVRSERKDGSKMGFDKFHVLGRDVERSVVTGRLAADILTDEGVEGYVPRGRWRGVVE